MRPPRRVPWSSKAELAELYDLIFSPAANEASRRLALSRMSVYISQPSCPAFMHLLHSLVSSLQLPYPPTQAQESSTARMAYALSLVRFVNGMVDPLQTGPYARPISHLAASLGLPPQLVALRHRATHEDLPPLSMLRQGVEQAVEYLHRHSFLPLLSSGSNELGNGGDDRRSRSDEFVAQWKKVVKSRVRAREVRKEDSSGRALAKLKRAAEDADLEELVEGVVRVGLVPVARKKRSGKGSLPTQESLLIWTPLLAHLAATHDAERTSQVLSHALVGALLDTAPRHAGPTPEDVDPVENRKEVASYRWTLGTWLIWLWGSAAKKEYGASGLNVLQEDREGVLGALARELLHKDDVLRRVYGVLSTETAAPSLDELDTLLDRENDQDAEDADGDSESDLDGLELDGEANDASEKSIDPQSTIEAMEANLRALEERVSGNRISGGGVSLEADADEEVAPGWRRVQEWQACPIGVWA